MDYFLLGGSFVCGIILAGPLFLIYCFVYRKQIVESNRLLTTGAVATGRVYALAEKRNHNNDSNTVSYNAVYNFEALDGKSYPGKFPIRKKDYQENQEVKVYYDKATPSKNTTERAAKSLAAGNKFFIILMVCMFVAPILIAALMCFLEM